MGEPLVSRVLWRTWVSTLYKPTHNLNCLFLLHVENVYICIYLCFIADRSLTKENKTKIVVLFKKKWFFTFKSIFKSILFFRWVCQSWNLFINSESCLGLIFPLKALWKNLPFRVAPFLIIEVPDNNLTAQMNLDTNICIMNER